jgi:Uma2 family endonuclease
MSTATRRTVPLGSDGASPSRGQGPLELMGPFASVPSLDELEELTDIPDRRVVFRGVDWAFYDRLVESIPEWRKIHVDYDGKDLEIVRYGILHHHAKNLLGILVSISAEESETPYMGLGGPTLKRPDVSCGLEPGASYHFDYEKRVATSAALKRHSNDIADYPNPDLAVEVDMTPPQVDRAGIYAALGVAEVWRFDGERVVIERLTSDRSYRIVEISGFLPIRAEDIRHWLVDENADDDTAFSRRFRAEIREQLIRDRGPGAKDKRPATNN